MCAHSSVLAAVIVITALFASLIGQPSYSPPHLVHRGLTGRPWAPVATSPDLSIPIAHTTAAMGLALARHDGLSLHTARQSGAPLTPIKQLLEPHPLHRPSDYPTLIGEWLLVVGAWATAAAALVWRSVDRLENAGDIGRRVPGLLDSAPPALPQYCFVILHDRVQDRLLLEELTWTELRTDQSGGELACFGGSYNGRGSPKSAVLTKCHEELGWQPAELQRVVDLYVAGRLLAWFYEAPAPGADVSFKLGADGKWASVDEALSTEMVTVWHKQVLMAWRKGQKEVRLEEGPPADLKPKLLGLALWVVFGLGLLFVLGSDKITY